MTEGHPNRWKILAVSLVATFMTLLDVSIVNVALPSIRQGLDAPESGLQWVVSGYALMFGLVLVPAGRLGDARGRRVMFMWGLALFTLASMAAGAAQSIGWLVAARLVQGVGSGVMQPQVAGLIQQLFRGAERGRAFGALGTVVGVATAVGPLAGGALIALAGPEHGWRWVFYVNVPVGLAGLVLAWRLIPGPPPGRRKESLDPVGVLLLAAGIVSLLLPLTLERQWQGSGKWLLVPVALAFLALFVLWELHHARRAEPLVDLNLYRFRSYSLGVAIAVLYFSGFTSIFFVFTLYLQIGLGYSALAAGVSIIPFAIGSGISAALSGRVVTRVGRRLVAAGLVVVLAGLAALYTVVALASGPGVTWWTALPLLVAGLGSGMVISPNQTLTLSQVPPREGGSAAATMQTGQRLGAALGIATSGAMLFAAVAGTRGDWALGFRHALTVVCAFVLAALLAALTDLALTRRAAPREGAGIHTPAAGPGSDR
ncbi:MFS transporter [Actinomadura craniellae]|uniref:MFS transporter n=1 Tax=Actinomadura craniellae TaxID=2231787 RepID=A0A365GWP5_9ACTN|nr:MFS transporter [Actinomadura craniellae]RAY11188.1 MFS transporter [Actinomadura craniellae]